MKAKKLPTFEQFISEEELFMPSAFPLYIDDITGNPEDKKNIDKVRRDIEDDIKRYRLNVKVINIEYDESDNEYAYYDITLEGNSEDMKVLYDENDGILVYEGGCIIEVVDLSKLKINDTITIDHKTYGKIDVIVTKIQGDMIYWKDQKHNIMGSVKSANADKTDKTDISKKGEKYLDYWNKEYYLDLKFGNIKGDKNKGYLPYTIEYDNLVLSEKIDYEVVDENGKNVIYISYPGIFYDSLKKIEKKYGSIHLGVPFAEFVATKYDQIFKKVFNHIGNQTINVFVLYGIQGRHTSEQIGRKFKDWFSNIRPKPIYKGSVQQKSMEFKKSMTVSDLENILC